MAAVKNENPKKICRICGNKFAPQEKTCPQHGETLRALDDPMLSTKVGSYTLVDRIGHGGTGTVYLGRQPVIGSRVAIKILTTEAAAEPKQLERFLTEAQAVNQIEHPNIVRILDLAKLADGRPYILMEYLEGATLKKRLTKGHKIHPEQLCKVILQVLDALQTAHEKGFVHRDLKPENIVITKDGQAKLFDFGIAKLTESAGASGLTETGTILGTPKYLSPEQAMGQSEKIGPATDIYAMGVILYEIYTGSLPFDTSNVYTLITAHINQIPPSPKIKNSLIPTRLEKLILQCLEKEPADRPASAATMAKEYEAAHKEFIGGLLDTLSEGSQPTAEILGKALPTFEIGETGVSVSGVPVSTSAGRRDATERPQLTAHDDDQHSARLQKTARAPAATPATKTRKTLFRLLIGAGTLGVLLLLLGGYYIYYGTNEGSSGVNAKKGRFGHATPPRGKLVILQRLDTGSIDPLYVDRTESINVLTNIYEPLVTFDPMTGQHRPWLCRSWKATPRGYTFVLKKNVTFSDDTRLTARAAVRSLRRTMRSKLGKSYFWDVKEIKVQSEHALSFVLSEPSGSFLTRLSLWPAFITKRHTPYRLGTGPYVVEDWNRQMGAVILKARKRFWAESVKTRKLIFRATPSPEARANLLVQGDAQVATGLDPTSIARLEKKPFIRIMQTASNVGVYLLFNTRKKALASAKIRRALSQAVDVNQLLESVYRHTGKRASSSLPPVMPTARQLRAFHTTRFDPQTARKTLAKTKLANKTLHLFLPAEPRASVPDPQKMALLLVESFKKAGVTVKPHLLPSSQFTAACRRGEHDMAVFGWIPDYPDPENIYMLLSRQGTAAGYNLALYQDETFDALLHKARLELNPTQRRKLFIRIEKRVWQQRPWYPLVFVSNHVALRKEVDGLRLGVEQCLGGADLFLRRAYLRQPDTAQQNKK
jgi:ABC-type transport system substrate-binding protein/tRNA A-37 threonylcarbamoyl transferase component Bud32